MSLSGIFSHANRPLIDEISIFFGSIYRGAVVTLEELIGNLACTGKWPIGGFATKFVEKCIFIDFSPLDTILSRLLIEIFLEYICVLFLIVKS